MKRIKILTTNEKKFYEMRKFFQESSIIAEHEPFELEEIQELDPLKVIKKKALNAIKSGHRNCLLDDAALYINGFNMLPGTLVKWFVKDLGIGGIFEMANKIGNLEARAEATLAYIDQDAKMKIFQGTTQGILVEPKEEEAFSWNAIFIPEGASKRYSEMNFEEIKKFGHRIKALNKINNFLG